MWVRGLKQGTDKYTLATTKSHPMWVRGLKLGCDADEGGEGVVAPHVGAWIETKEQFKINMFNEVAPHVGAWIETRCLSSRLMAVRVSHPMWVRGLKLVGVDVAFQQGSRTPCGCVD